MPRGIPSDYEWATKVAKGPEDPPYPKREPTGPPPDLEPEEKPEPRKSYATKRR
jgi:hypothetical protein